MAISNIIFGGGGGGGGSTYLTNNTTIDPYAYEYERERMRQLEHMKYQEEQMRRMMNQQPLAVMPVTPKAPDPLGFLTKADNKLLLTTGETK